MRRFLVRTFKNSDCTVIGIAETLPNAINYRAGLYYENALSWKELTREAVKHITYLLDDEEKALIVSNIETMRSARKRPRDSRVSYYYEPNLKRLGPAEHIAYNAKLTGVTITEKYEGEN